MTISLRIFELARGFCSARRFTHFLDAPVRKRAAIQHACFSASSIRAEGSFTASRLEELRNKVKTGNRRYTAAEDAKLLSLREAGHSLSRISAHFPDRSMYSIKSRHLLLGEASKFSKKGWTRAQILELCRLRTEGRSWPEIASTLQRPQGSCKYRLAKEIPEKHRPKYQFWTPEEDSRLLEMSEKMVPQRIIATELGRARYAVKARWQYLVDIGIPRQMGTQKKWTDEEDQKLLNTANGEDPGLVERTKRACNTRLGILRRKSGHLYSGRRWTDEEDRSLLNAAKGETPELVGRTKNACLSRLGRLRQISRQVDS